MKLNYLGLMDDYIYIIENNMEITDDFLDEEIMIEDGVNLEAFKNDIENVRELYYRRKKLQKIKSRL